VSEAAPPTTLPGSLASAGKGAWVVAGDEAGSRLDVALAMRHPEVSRSQWSRLIQEGDVRVNGERGAPSRKLRLGDRVDWSIPPPAVTDLVAEDIPLDVVYEDEHLAVINKPAGLVVHPAPGHEGGTLVNALLARLGDLRGIGGELRPGIVHRIDKDTSGLLVVAKNDATMNALGAAFKRHDIVRVYEALVVGKPPGPEGRIDTLHGRDPHDRKKFSIKVKSGKRAKTAWKALEWFPGAARIEARLETGRTHQVRVHMAALGCPLLADAVYGRPPKDAALKGIAKALGRQALHARVLGFRHPATGKEWVWEAPPPPDFAEALRSLRTLAADNPRGQRP